MSDHILAFLLGLSVLTSFWLALKVRGMKRVEADLVHRGQKNLDELNRYRRTYQVRETDGHTYITVDGGKRYYEVRREQDGSLQVMVEPDQAAAAIFLDKAITQSHIEARVARGLAF